MDVRDVRDVGDMGCPPAVERSSTVDVKKLELECLSDRPIEYRRTAVIDALNELGHYPSFRL